MALVASSANIARSEVAGALARGPTHQAQLADHPGFGKGTGVLAGAHAHHVLAHIVVAQVVQRRRGVELGAVVDVSKLAQQLKLLAAVGQPRVERRAVVPPASCALRPSNSMRAPLGTPQKRPHTTTIHPGPCIQHVQPSQKQRRSEGLMNAGHTPDSNLPVP